MSEHEDVAVPEGYPNQKIQDRVVVKWAPLSASAIGLVTMIVVSLGLVRAFELVLQSDGRPAIHANAVQEGFEQPSGVAPLDPAQVPVKKAYLEEQHKLLTSYGWVDQEKKLARIPIDRAKALVVEKYGK